jgi:hypothetical protein
LFGVGRATGSRFQCVGNLKNVGLGFRTFAVDFDGKYPWQVDPTNGGIAIPPVGEAASPTNNVFTVFACISNEISTTKILHCPEDPRIPAPMTFAQGVALGDKAADYSSYFIGVSASDESVSSILGGDRHLLVKSAGLDYQDPRRYNRVVRLGASDVRSSNTNNIAWSPVMHSGCGNILLGDGSVQQCKPGQVPQLFRDAWQERPTNIGLFMPAL